MTVPSELMVGLGTDSARSGAMRSSGSRVSRPPKISITKTAEGTSVTWAGSMLRGWLRAMRRTPSPAGEEARDGAAGVACACCCSCCSASSASWSSALSEPDSPAPDDDEESRSARSEAAGASDCCCPSSPLQAAKASAAARTSSRSSATNEERSRKVRANGAIIVASKVRKCLVMSRSLRLYHQRERLPAS